MFLQIEHKLLHSLRQWFKDTDEATLLVYLNARHMPTIHPTIRDYVPLEHTPGRKSNAALCQNGVEKA